MRGPTYEQHSSIVEFLKAGNFFETACAAAGVRVTTARNWLLVGTDPDAGDCTEFRNDVLKAMAEAEASLVNVMHEAALAGDSKAAMQLLERRYPVRWAQKIRVVVEEQLSAAVDRVERLESEIGREALDRVLDALAGDVRGPEAEIEAASDLH